MAHEAWPRGDEFFQRRGDVVEVDIGDEAVDAGVDAGRCDAVHIGALFDEIGERAQIGEAARIGRFGRVAANALEMIALEIVVARLGEAFFADPLMLAHEGAAEGRIVALVFPARIRHHPIEIVEQPCDEEIEIALARAERRIERQLVLLREMGVDGLAVADSLAIVDDIGQLPARRRRGIEDMLMREGQPREAHEGEHLQPIAVVVGDAEERRIGIERDHDADSTPGPAIWKTQRMASWMPR
jgi:hypothetical protein